MAEILVEGINLGYTEKSYDFTDDFGERRVGVTQRVHVLVGTEVLDVRVPDEGIARVKALAVKSPVSMVVNIPRNARLSFVDTAAATKAA